MRAVALVTGANGYTGSHLCRYLAAKEIATRGMYWEPDGLPDFTDPHLEWVSGDLRDRESLKRALDGVEVVYNIAALYRPTNVSNQMFWDVNVDGVGNVVELAAEAGVRRFVQCSTIGVHGDIEQPPADENAPIKPADFYQRTKYEGEKLSRELADRLNLRLAVVRPAAIYGPLERRFLQLPRLIQKQRFVMFGDGEVLYHFIQIEDLCRAFELCAELEQAVGQTYIIADDHAITLNQVVDIISEALGVRRPRLRLPLFVLDAASIGVEFACKPFGLSPPLHRRRASFFKHTRSFDISKARNELGFEPQIRPREGWTQMIQSYREAGWID